MDVTVLELLESSNININFTLMFTISLFAIGLISIGISAFNFNATSPGERLFPLYLGSFLIALASFISAYNGYIPW